MLDVQILREFSLFYTLCLQDVTETLAVRRIKKQEKKSACLL